MERILEEFLFARQILAAPEDIPRDDWAETLLALSSLFGIEIAEGAALAHPRMIRLAQECLGRDVPEPFYRGFPASVRKLTRSERLFDRLIHYTRTYGLGDFSRPGHSLLEASPRMGGAELISAVLAELDPDAPRPERLAEITRSGLTEMTEPRRFVILSGEAAEEKLRESVTALLESSRPLSLSQLDAAAAYLRTHPLQPERVGCKDTAIALALATMDPAWGRFLRLPDVIPLAEAVCGLRAADAQPGPDGEKRVPGLKDLMMPNRYRKLIARVIDGQFLGGTPDVRDCFARQADWCGLLHHIHYRPINEAAEAFVRDIRSGVNRSPQAAFERALREKGPEEAADLLARSQGAGAVARRLDRLLSSCRDSVGAEKVLAHLDGVRPLTLIQLLLHYGEEPLPGGRTFRFVKEHRMRTHLESAEEAARRSPLSPALRALALERTKAALRAKLAGRLGRVYIDPDMRRIALPLQEGASMGGIGVLPRGSRVPLDLTRTLRGFIYWEKVDDIDLSVIGLDGEGNQEEFSWRTDEWETADAPILYSGDETAGYDGGSEYFDVDVRAFRKRYPHLRFLVFCGNIFTSGVRFDQCECRAGWMARKEVDSGEVYEPKTVRSAFPVRGGGRFACLFGVDLEREELVWLNVQRSNPSAVAGASSLAFLLPWFRIADRMNLALFFEMLARERTEDPAEAEILVTDQPVPLRPDQRQIRSQDTEQILQYLNMP